MESITLPRFPGIIAQVDAGSVVLFGAVQITLNGIRFSPNSAVIPWARVVQAVAGPAEWSVAFRHPSKPDKVTHSSGRTDETPNTPLMAALCTALSVRARARPADDGP